MNFADAAKTSMPFGKYRGKTIDHVAAADDGLLYLDWLRGEREKRIGAFAHDPQFDVALRTYLDDATIAGELTKLARGRG